MIVMNGRFLCFTFLYVFFFSSYAFSRPVDSIDINRINSFESRFYIICKDYNAGRTVKAERDAKALQEELNDYIKGMEYFQLSGDCPAKWYLNDSELTLSCLKNTEISWAFGDIMHSSVKEELQNFPRVTINENGYSRESVFFTGRFRVLTDKDKRSVEEYGWIGGPGVSLTTCDLDDFPEISIFAVPVSVTPAATPASVNNYISFPEQVLQRLKDGEEVRKDEIIEALKAIHD